MTKQPRTLQNPLAIKLLAQRLRQKMMTGYQPQDRFALLLAKLTDEELVGRYIAKSEPKPPQLKQRITRVKWS